jgi:hypothetical protein
MRAWQAIVGASSLFIGQFRYSAHRTL